MLVMENEEEGTDLMKEKAAKLRATIGDNIKGLREDASKKRVSDGERKFTQEAFAEELTKAGYAVQPGQIGHVEVARKFPSLPLLVAIADYFATSLDFIAGRTKNQSSLAEIEEDLQTGGISGRLGEIYKRLSQDRQEEVYKFAQALDILQQQSNNGADGDTMRFVQAMLDAFEKRIGTKGIESALDELAGEFPELTAGLGSHLQPPKKKRG